MTIARKNFNDHFNFAVKPTERQAFRDALNQAIKLVNKNGKITYKDWANDNTIFDKNN